MTALSYAGKGSLAFAFIKDTQQGLWGFSKNMFCLCIILSKNYIFTYSQVFLICLFLYKDAPVFYNITIHLSNSVVIIITFVPLPFFSGINTDFAAMQEFLVDFYWKRCPPVD